MSGKRATPEGVYGELDPRDLRDMAKAERLQARFQWLLRGPLNTTPRQGQRMLDGGNRRIECLPTAGHLAISQGKER